ncbi:MAG: hypothetical protein WC648_03925 [Candidatus Paceibacterota bacterium]|jgi:hypothetical protein
MISYDENTISEKFLKLPEEIQVALSSVEIGRTIKSIGDKYELKLDQEQILYDQIGLVMLGLLPSKDFVKTFSKEANIENEVSHQIASDVNKEVFDKLKLSMRETEDEQELPETKVPSIADAYKERPTIAPLPPTPPAPVVPRVEVQEEMGPAPRFEPKPEPAPTPRLESRSEPAPTSTLRSTPEPIPAPQPRPQYTPPKNLDALTFQREPVKPLFDSATTERDREKYLSHLENPPWKKQPEIKIEKEQNEPEQEPIQPININIKKESDVVIPTNINIKKETNTVPPTHTEPLVDLLLSNSTGRPTEITRNKVEAAVPENLPVVPNAENQSPPTGTTKPTSPTNIPSRRIGPDPYKEPVE